VLTVVRVVAVGDRRLTICIRLVVLRVVGRLRGLLMLAAAGTACVAWALSSPAGSAPDGDYHLANVWCAGGADRNVCERDPASGEYRVPRGLLRYSGPLGHLCYVGNSGASAGCLRDIDATVATQLESTSRLAFTLEPSIFARTQHAFVGSDVERAAWRMRVANVLVALGALAVAASLAREGARALAVALVAIGAPVGVFFVTAVHPQSWVFALLPTGWLVADAAIQRLAAARSVRWGAALALGVVMMWLAYDARPQDGWAFVGIAALVLVARHAPASAADRRVRLALGAIGVLAALFIFRRLGGLDGAIAQLDLGDADGAWRRLVSDAPGTLRDIVGGGNALGSSDVPMPPIVGVFGVVALGTAMAAAHVRMPRWSWAVFGALVFLVVFLPWRLGDIGVSGRYVWVLAAIALTYYFLECRPGGVVIAEMPRTARRVIVASAGLANAFALHAHIRRYVTGSDVVGWNLNRDAEWWWPFGPAPMTTWLLGSAAFAVAAGLVMFPARRPT